MGLTRVAMTIKTECTLCGTGIPAGATECPSCGFPVEAAAVPEPNPTPAPAATPKAGPPKPDAPRPLDEVKLNFDPNKFDDDLEFGAAKGFEIKSGAGVPIEWKKATQPAVPRQRLLAIVLGVCLALFAIVYFTVLKKPATEDAPAAVEPVPGKPIAPPPTPGPQNVKPATPPSHTRPTESDPGQGDSAIGE
ncbi:MAG: zinc ribbon domain-containing protein [Chthonomonas sp.]|nr:zinc ribbon domain-containing protein [Chthonomonas sp.]